MSYCYCNLSLKIQHIDSILKLMTKLLSGNSQKMYVNLFRTYFVHTDATDTPRTLNWKPSY